VPPSATPTPASAFSFPNRASTTSRYRTRSSNTSWPAGLPVITSNARAQAELVTETSLGIVADLGDLAGSARRIATWAPPSVTRDAVERHGLTWEQEERELERVYRAQGLV
jgi:hypothetical protein